MDMEALQVYTIANQTAQKKNQQKWRTASKKSEDWMLTTWTGKKLGYLPNQVSTQQFHFSIWEEMPSIEKMIGQDKILVIYPADENKAEITWEGVDQLTEQVNQDLFSVFL